MCVCEVLVAVVVGAGRGPHTRHAWPTLWQMCKERAAGRWAGGRTGYARVKEIGQDERPGKEEVEKLICLVVFLAESCP